MHLPKQMVLAYIAACPKAIVTSKVSLHRQLSIKTDKWVGASAHSEVYPADSNNKIVHGEEKDRTKDLSRAVHYKPSTE